MAEAPATPAELTPKLGLLFQGTLVSTSEAREGSQRAQAEPVALPDIHVRRRLIRSGPAISETRLSFTGPNDALQLFGITLIGVSPENGRKLLLTIVVVLAVIAISRLLHAMVGKVTRKEPWPRAQFWTRQAINILIALVTLTLVVSIWF